MSKHSLRTLVKQGHREALLSYQPKRASVRFCENRELALCG